MYPKDLKTEAVKPNYLLYFDVLKSFIVFPTCEAVLILERVDSLSIKPLPSVQHLTSLLQVYSFWSKVRLVAVSHTPHSTYLPGVEVVEHFEMNIFWCWSGP